MARNFTTGLTNALTMPNSSPMNRNVRTLPDVVFEPPLTLMPVTRVAIQIATAFTTTLMAKDFMPNPAIAARRSGRLRRAPEWGA